MASKPPNKSLERDEKLHYLNPVPIHEIAERWIRPFERGRLEALRDLKSQLERLL